METKDYTVTELAGPKVAGRRVEPGDTISLTEVEARAELLAGSIAEAGKEAKVEAAMAGTKKLPDVQARARGAASAKAEKSAQATEPAASADAPAER